MHRTTQLNPNELWRPRGLSALYASLLCVMGAPLACSSIDWSFSTVFLMINDLIKTTHAQNYPPPHAHPMTGSFAK